MVRQHLSCWVVLLQHLTVLLQAPPHPWRVDFVPAAFEPWPSLHCCPHRRLRGSAFEVSTGEERLGSSTLPVLSACLQLVRTKPCCAKGWALGRKPVSATAVFSVLVSYTYKKLGMNWEVWKEIKVAEEWRESSNMGSATSTWYLASWNHQWILVNCGFHVFFLFL